MKFIVKLLKLLKFWKRMFLNILKAKWSLQITKIISLKMDKSKMLIKWWNKTKNMLNHKLYKIKYHLGTWNNLRITNKINNKAKKTTI